jgi:hypothetical protein
MIGFLRSNDRQRLSSGPAYASSPSRVIDQIPGPLNEINPEVTSPRFSLIKILFADGAAGKKLLLKF